MNSRSWALFNMRRNKNTEFTKSEMKLVDELTTNCFPEDITQKELDDILRLQFRVKNLKEIDGIRPTKPGPKLDIAILPLKIAIRVNGEIHLSHRNRQKDEDQKEVLEGNGWTVIDVDYDDREDLWK